MLFLEVIGWVWKGLREEGRLRKMDSVLLGLNFKELLLSHFSKLGIKFQ